MNRDLNRAVRSAIRSDRRRDIQQEIGERGPARVWRWIKPVVAGKRGDGSVRPDAGADQLNESLLVRGWRRRSDRGGRSYLNFCRHSSTPCGACSLTVSPVTREMLGRKIFGIRSSTPCGAHGGIYIYSHAEDRLPSYR